MFRSATFKLTLWYLGIVVAISLIFSVLLYNVTTGELSRGLNRETQRIDTQFPIFDNNPMLRPGPDYDDSAHRILLRLVSFNIIVFVGAGFASYWLARRTLQPIEEAHEQQKRFTADVSHELRTPLTALKMESEVALMNKQNDKASLRATISSNLEEAAKLETLINNLLRLTRLDADELQQNFTPLSTKVITVAAIEKVTPSAKLKHIKLDDSVKELPILGDQDGLTQLLVILLDNAIKFSPANSTVWLSSHRTTDQIQLRIKDAGIGIEPSALDHVFDRFYRADSSRTKVTDSEGFGLGLSIAKMIADVHNGTITIMSQPGHGTTVTILLPVISQPPSKNISPKPANQ